MKKLYALVVLGAFIAALGVLSPTWLYPRFAVIPRDLDAKVVAQSPAGAPARYFDVATLKPAAAELRSVTSAVVDSRASDAASSELGRDVLVLRNSACVDKVSVTCADQRFPLAAAISTYAVDERSGEPVMWKRASIETGGAVETGVRFAGLTTKFPFDAKRKPYAFWNPDLREALPVKFVKETSVHGLRVFEFRQDLAPTMATRLDVPGNIVDHGESTVRVDSMVSGRTTYFVEPETGVVISVIGRVDNYAVLDGKRVLTLTRGTLVTPAEDVRDAVDEYRPLSKLLFAVRVLVPWIATPVGAVMLLVGGLLIRRRHLYVTDAGPKRPPVAVV